ncbi:MAG: hypothetical protein UT33_C0005G0016 [Candidatus Peregrinibacteria bacterium GW2011_GWC2_39_14]|nr:MAG: hypothetical protein US92_C0001G0016 [Candidatus Peregrinibacteria bacterium GW2011_GWA2_38_36]KKR07072.1 MAG: hypothetical protein UT33_C0005G0016 [Candidatus Peregrinibacteria bacterium GW2011_GWC2_39_14]
MKKLLILIPFAVAFIFAMLYRGGISLHSHFLWAGLLFIPALTLLFTRNANKSSNKTSSLANIFLIFFIATFFLSIALAPISGFGIYDFLAYVSGAVTFLIISQTTLSQKTIDKGFTFLVASASGLSLAGLIFYIYLSPTRVFSTFVDFNMLAVSFPNAFALFLLLIIPITIYKLVNAESAKLKLYTIATMLQFSAFILTFSRTSWLMLVIAAIITTIILLKKIKTSKSFLILSGKRIVFAFLIALLLAYGCSLFRSINHETQNPYNKITFQADEGKTSYTDRLNLFGASMKIFSENPWIGYGPSAFDQIAKNHQHNLYLKITNDSGIFALAFFVAFLIFIALSIKKLTPEITVLGTSVLLALGQSEMDFNLNFVSNSLLFWGFLGIIASLSKQNKISKKLTPGYKNPYIILAALLSLILLFVSAHEAFYKLKYKEGQNLYKNGKYEDALIKFESAQPLFFKQDLNYLIGKTYIRMSKGAPPYSNLGIRFLSELSQNEKSIAVKTVIYELCLVNEEKECLTWAIPELKKIYEYTKSNSNLNKNIRIYYDYLAALYKSGLDYEIKNLLPEIHAFLDQYQIAIEHNEQLAITSENPGYALKIHDLIIDFARKFKESETEINKLILTKTRLNRAINNEKRKYKTLYGQEPEVE